MSKYLLNRPQMNRILRLTFIANPDVTYNQSQTEVKNEL